MTRQPKLLCSQKEQSYCLHDFRNYLQKSASGEKVAFDYKSFTLSNGLCSSSAWTRAIEFLSSFEINGCRVVADLCMSLSKFCGLQWPHSYRK